MCTIYSVSYTTDKVKKSCRQKLYRNENNQKIKNKLSIYKLICMFCYHFFYFFLMLD